MHSGERRSSPKACITDRDELAQEEGGDDLLSPKNDGKMFITSITMYPKLMDVEDLL